MRLGILFSGGKDSVYAAYLAKKIYNHELSCLITLDSKNKDSFMFHTPSINKTKYQAKAMNIPLIVEDTLGKKEDELKDLKSAIQSAVKKYHIQGIITGAIQSVYQSSRIQKICNELNIECFNPLWQKDESTYLDELIKNRFKVIITGVFAYPFDNSWLGREINKDFIDDIQKLTEKYHIHPAGEGGEFETFVIDCPLFQHQLKIKSHKDIKEGSNSYRREVDIA